MPACARCARSPLVRSGSDNRLLWQELPDGADELLIADWPRLATPGTMLHVEPSAPAADTHVVRRTRQDLAMTFKPAIWRPIAVVLSAINLLGAGFAAGSAEPWH